MIKKNKVIKYILALFAFTIIFVHGIDCFTFDTISLALFVLLILLLLFEFEPIASLLQKYFADGSISKDGISFHFRDLAKKALDEKEDSLRSELKLKDQEILSFIKNDSKVKDEKEFLALQHKRDELQRSYEDLQIKLKKLHALSRISATEFDKNTERIADYIHSEFYDDIDDYFISSTKPARNFCIDHHLSEDIMVLMRRNGFIDAEHLLTPLAVEELTQYYLNLIFND